MRVGESRWKRAQERESRYWTARSHQIVKGDTSELDWYEWRSNQLARKLFDSGNGELANGRATVLEIGSGPVGVVSFFPAAVSVAVDPLASFYGKSKALTTVREREVRYLEAKGEGLPIRGGACHLVIIENCLDHVADVDAVMAEITRVLCVTGVLYLTINCRMRIGFAMHRLLSRLALDSAHPHTFTPRRVRELLNTYGFKPVVFETASYSAALRADLRLGSPRSLVKGLLGVSEFLVSALAVRE
jgi:SAM-dependent methyltransferase